MCDETIMGGAVIRSDRRRKNAARTSYDPGGAVERSVFAGCHPEGLLLSKALQIDGLAAFPLVGR
jgi:hypothetical protein